MANILLIYPEPDEVKSARFGFSLDLLYLSSILKKAGHKIEYKDYAVENFCAQGLIEQLEKADVVVVELDSFPLKRSTNVSKARQMVQLIGELKLSIKIVAFGKDCILFPRKMEYVDFTFDCEPEPSICNVVDMLVNSTLNMDEIVLKDKVVLKLDTLPFPDRSLLSGFAEHGGTVNRKPFLAKSTLVQTSRGCLNSCIFCQRQGWNTQYRFRSMENVLSEFREIRDNNYINIWVSDDNFSFNLPRAKDILEGFVHEDLTKDMKLALSSWTKIDVEFLDLAKKAGVSLISFGIESANNHILDFYQKDLDLRHVEMLIRYADSIGIYTVGNFIIGAPMETEESINNTFEYALNIPFDQVNVKILDYMAGSKLYESLDKEYKEDKRHIFACKENGLNNFPLAYLKGKIDKFNKMFNRRKAPNFIMKLRKYGMPYKLLET
ncbi:MAG: hypothetical protein APF76_10915 [Desulfitibacter sp. BRH_c19]|nr:MAG: hypothetical protein APF76_10915 [Desulfitibacter sp. BRH_c19]